MKFSLLFLRVPDASDMRDSFPRILLEILLRAFFFRLIGPEALPGHPYLLTGSISSKPYVPKDLAGQMGIHMHLVGHGRRRKVWGTPHDSRVSSLGRLEPVNAPDSDLSP